MEDLKDFCNSPPFDEGKTPLPIDEKKNYFGLAIKNLFEMKSLSSYQKNGFT